MAIDGQSPIVETLHEILATVKALQREHTQLSAAVDAIEGKVNVLSVAKQASNHAAAPFSSTKPNSASASASASRTPDVIRPGSSEDTNASDASSSNKAVDGAARRSSLASKITLTSYPGQSGVDPISLTWGVPDPIARGPVVVSRNSKTIRRRNGKRVFHWSREFLCFTVGFNHCVFGLSSLVSRQAD